MAEVSPPPSQGWALQSLAEAPHPCPCCGAERHGWRVFGRLDGEAQAFMLVAHVPSHPGGWAEALVSLGPWWAGSGPEARLALAFSFHDGPEAFRLCVESRESSPWGPLPEMGDRLEGEAAMGHPALFLAQALLEAWACSDEGPQTWALIPSEPLGSSPEG